jgi:hypothetical protein
LIFPSLLLAPIVGGAETYAPDVPTEYRPDTSSDEAGLWMQVEKLEKEIAISPMRITDEALNAYVSDIVCELAGEYCGDIRVYILRNPYFNASMWPNGMMHVWTGLLLRTKNEAQLAAVLGHEIAHYLGAHSIERWRKIRNSTSFTAFLNLGLAAAGAGAAGDVVNLALIASISAYSRDHERESDRHGMQLMAKAGYDPLQASAIWQYLIAEDDNAIDKRKGNIFTATHPSEKERARSLQEYAQENFPDTDFTVGEESYMQQLEPHFSMLMEDQLRLHHHGRTEILLDSFDDSLIAQGKLYYFRGEFYRLRKQEGDTELAMDAYRTAIQHADVPADTYRQLGYLYLKNKEIEAAQGNFRAYLEYEPDASDREMIEFYLNVKPGSSE